MGGDAFPIGLCQGQPSSEGPFYSLSCQDSAPAAVEPQQWSWILLFAALFRHFQNLETIKAAQWGLIVLSQSAGCCICQIDVAAGWLLC